VSTLCRWPRCEAFDLEPQSAIAGRVRRIDAFRDDPLDRQGAGFLVESRAQTDLMIAVLQRSGGSFEQADETRFAFGQRPRAEIFAIEVEKIEQKEHQAGGVAGV
jgi:hypothetical protein